MKPERFSAFLFLILIISCSHTTSQLAPSSNAQTLIGNGAGKTTNIARRAALGELSSQLSARIQSTCKDRMATSLRNGVERRQDSSQCDVVLTTQTSEQWGDWVQLTECRSEPKGNGITSICRLSRSVFAKRLERRIAAPWAQYKALAATLNQTPKPRDQATWIAAYHRVGVLQTKMQPILDAMFVLQQRVPTQSQQMQTETRNWANEAQILRQDVVVQIQTKGASDLSALLRQTTQQSVAAIGLRHSLSAECTTASAKTLLVQLNPQIQCTANASGHSVCRLHVNYSTQRCSSTAQRQGVWTAPFEGRDYNGDQREAQRIVAAHIKNHHHLDLLRAALFEEVPVP
jgi:hypothetical protein